MADACDWVVAFDDQLTERWRSCIWCRADARRLELWSAADGFALAIASCHACLATASTGQRRQALVEAHAQRRAVVP